MFRYKSKTYFKISASLVAFVIATGISSKLIASYTENLKAERVAMCRTQFPNATEMVKVFGLRYCRTHPNSLQRFSDVEWERLEKKREAESND